MNKVICSHCGNKHEKNEVMISSGEYGQKDFIICFNCLENISKQ